MSLNEFLARAAMATYTLLLAVGFGGVAYMLIRQIRFNLEWERELEERKRKLEERKRLEGDHE